MWNKRKMSDASKTWQQQAVHTQHQICAPKYHFYFQILCLAMLKFQLKLQTKVGSTHNQNVRRINCDEIQDTSHTRALQWTTNSMKYRVQPTLIILTLQYLKQTKKRKKTQLFSQEEDVIVEHKLTCVDIQQLSHVHALQLIQMTMHIRYITCSDADG